MSTHRQYLIVRANGDMRVIQRFPALAWDEVAFPIIVSFPDTWGKVRTSLEAGSLIQPEPIDPIENPELSA